MPRVIANHPDFEIVGRLGGLTRSQDIAIAAYFLCAARAGLITGQALVADAGKTLKYAIEFPEKLLSDQSVRTVSTSE
jgi:flagellar biosynthesis protein FlhB